MHKQGFLWDVKTIAYFPPGLSRSDYFGLTSHFADVRHPSRTKDYPTMSTLTFIHTVSDNAYEARMDQLWTMNRILLADIPYSHFKGL